MRKNRYDRQAVKNQEATGKRGRKADGLIKGRNKDGPQERGRRKEINGVDARRQKDGNTDDNNITSSHRQQANVKTCALAPFRRGKRHYRRGKGKDRRVLKKRCR